MNSKNLLVLFFALVSLGATAQNKRVVADKIIGKVGDRIILKSDLSNAMEDARRQQQELPPNPECAFFESELVKKALVLQAEKDSIEVDDAEIEGKLENQIRGFIGMYGKDAVEEIYGKSVAQLKEDFRKDFKEREMATRMRGKIIENVRITPIEVKDFFQKKDPNTLPYYESELEVGQIIIYPKADRDIESYTAKQLNDIKKQIESGSKRFEQMARVYSEDPAVKENGGQYNLNRADKFWDPVFLATAFKLKDGQISNVVKSKFGLHLIQCVSRNGDDAVVRHILMIPPITQQELDEAKAKLDSARSKLIAGTITWSEAVDKYSNNEDDKFNGGWIMSPDQTTFVTIDQLDKSLIPQLTNLKPGQYSQPEVFANEQGKKGVRFLYLRTRTQPHRENLEQDYNKIAAQALEEKRMNILSTWFNDKISTYYIYVDPEYNRCSNLGNWYQASVKKL